MTMDIFPTLCSLAGTPGTFPADGKSLAGCIDKDEPFSEERTLFWVYREGEEYKGQAVYAVRKGPYKLMQNSPFEDFRLYNLKTDPHEQIPLNRSSGYYKNLHKLLIQHIQENNGVLWKETAGGKIPSAENGQH